MSKIYQMKANFKGLVQGVFFRAAVKKLADNLNIKGYVKNKKDASVEVMAIGDKKSLEKLLEEIKKKPGSGHLDKIDVAFSDVTKSFESFEIEY